MKRLPVALLVCLCILPIDGMALDLENNALDFTQFNIIYDNHVVTEIDKITCFVQDKQGYIWIGTNSGAYRYNTFSFEPYSYWVGRDTSHSMLNPHINCLLTDADDNLWIGTDAGLSKLDTWRTHYVHYTTGTNPNKSLSHDQINALVQDGKGTIWVGTEAGLNRLHPDTGRVEHFFSAGSRDSDMPNVAVTSLCIVSDEQIWIGTNNLGVIVFHPQDRSFVNLNQKLEAQSLPVMKQVHCIECLPSGLVWIGTYDQGLYQVDPSGYSSRHFSKQNSPNLLSNIVQTIARSDDGTIWLGTPYGLNRYDANKNRFVYDVHRADNPLSLSSNRISAMHVDYQGGVWLGTIGGTLNRYDPMEFHFQSLQHNPFDPATLSNNQVTSICQDRQGRIWIGSRDGQINQLNPQTKEIRRHALKQILPQNISVTSITALSCDERSIWVGTLGSGLLQFHFEEIQDIPEAVSLVADGNALQKFPNKTVRSLEMGRHGDVYVGTENSGLLVYSPQSGASQVILHDPSDSKTLSSPYVTAIEESQDGKVWIGTYGKGLNRYDPATGSVRRIPFYPNRQGIESSQLEMYKDYFEGQDEEDKFSQLLSSQNNLQTDAKRFLVGSIVNDILQDSQGRLWVGTNESLNQLDPATGLAISFSSHFEDTKYNVRSIVESHSGDLWICTYTGMVRLSSDLSHLWVYSNLVNQQNHCYPSCSLSSNDEMLYWGGLDGITYLNERNVQFNSYQPPVGIFHIHIDTNLSRNTFMSPFYIDQTILHTFPYGTDYFDFNVASLNYTFPEFNQVKYTFKGTDQGWHVLKKEDVVRIAHLEPGDYEFIAVGANNDGVWSEEETTFRFRLLPPFWATWWFRSSAVGCAIVMASIVIAIAQRKLRRKLNRRTAQLETERFFSKNILEFSPVIVLGLKPDGELTYINPTGIAWIGNSHSLLGKKWWTITVQERERNELQSIHHQACQTNQYAREISLTFTTGDTRIINWKFVNHQDENGNLIRIYAFGDDLTEQLEKQILDVSSREQQRIGRELHDSLCQSLTGVMLMCTTMRKQYGTIPNDRGQEILSGIYQQLQRITNQSKNLARGLYLHELENHGLEKALEEMVANFQSLFQIQCEFICDGPLNMNNMEREVHLYRFVQEALSNAAKHSMSDSIQVHIQATNHHISAHIRDFGIGFSQTGTNGKGMGLNIMKFRTKKLNGTFEIKSQEGQGTEVSCTLPNEI